MSKKIEKSILKKGNASHYFIIKSFPKGVRDDVAKLYSFIRVVGDYANDTPADVESFKYIVRRWQALKKQADFGRFVPANESIAERILGNICYIVHRFECDPAWVDSYLKSMAMDVRVKNFATIKDTCEYMDGSAEAVGLLLAKTLRLPNASLHFAKMQGRAFQFAIFLRDLNANSIRNHHYFPSAEIKKFGLERLDEANALKKPEEYKKFIRFQVKRYRLWQKEASRGLKFVPRRIRVPLHTAIDLYSWTAKKIDKDPFIVFDKKLLPRKSKVIRRTVRRTFQA